MAEKREREGREGEKRKKDVVNVLADVHSLAVRMLRASNLRRFQDK